ncbi:hypothetical protein NP233_g1812 [Leucocoprinus birnbaumii]|uniref:F-box domain-containing protein n=1 Tax=Leucocoprinus birnbaumii TaxID=56174 RepID=A0AAD5W1G8_9AGAR|nr:hypothetical protein NP233_g1812 [Leucocoprinus birnbaumii]
MLSNSPELLDPNAHHILVQFPPELIVRIYRINAYRGYDSSSCCLQEFAREGIPSPLRDTINASQVCHRLREITLSSPQLWSRFIDVYHPRVAWVELLLQRSQPLGIDLLQSGHCQTGKISLPINVRRQISYEVHKRVISYRMRPNSRFWSSFGVWPETTNSWPMLEHLCLLYAHIYNWDQGGGSESRMLPENFPGRATPVLRRLHLQYCWMPDRWSNLKVLSDTLTCLVIEFPPKVAHLTLNGWMEIFNDLPHLDALTLSCALQNPLDYEEPSKAFTLDIKSFTLKDRPKECVHFFNHVSLTQTCHFFSLQCCTNSTFILDDSLRALMAHAKRFYHELAMPQLFSKTVVRILYAEIGIWGLPQSSSDTVPFPLLDEDDQLSDLAISKFRCSFHHGFNTDICQPFPWASSEVDPIKYMLLEIFSEAVYAVEHVFLGLSLYMETDKDALFEILTRGNKISTLSYISPELWKSLYRALALGGPQDNSTLPLLCKISLDETHHLTNKDRDGSTVLEELVRLCEHRARIDLPIHRVELCRRSVRRELPRKDVLKDIVTALAPLGVEVTVEEDDRHGEGRFGFESEDTSSDEDEEEPDEGGIGVEG